MKCITVGFNELRVAITVVVEAMGWSLQNDPEHSSSPGNGSAYCCALETSDAQPFSDLFPPFDTSPHGPSVSQAVLLSPIYMIATLGIFWESTKKHMTH